MNKLQMPKKDADQIRFAEFMGGFFHDFLRAAGITMTPGNTMERVRAIGEKMGKAISDQAEKKAVQIIEQLQDHVIAGFVKMEEAFDKVKDLQVKSSTMTLDTRDELRALRARVAALESAPKATAEDQIGAAYFDKDN